MDFTNKIVLVTGGSSGIGKATVFKYVNCGAKVIFTSKQEPTGKKVYDQLKGDGDHSWIQMDVMDTKSIDTLFEHISENYGKLDIAFNNAVSGGATNKIADINLDDWNETIQGTLTSTFYSMKHELNLMSNGATIINNASVDGLRAFPMDPIYSAAKHGVIGLTKSAALQYAREGIRINAIAPGWIDTPPVQKIIQQHPPSKELMLSHQPIGRLGKPEEIADLVVWLSSPEASFILGTTIAIDGGYTAV
ncbi:MAG: SDR family oxidoreductase [Candidatus Heimdallarchaeota archaeon]|nr:SDR family oxidoreductase [Candidatus Heimdallarchaeota archaeon]